MPRKAGAASLPGGRGGCWQQKMNMIHAHKCECGTVERVLCDVADCPKVDKCNKCSGVSALIEAAAETEEIFTAEELESL